MLKQQEILEYLPQTWCKGGQQLVQELGHSLRAAGKMLVKQTGVQGKRIGA